VRERFKGMVERCADSGFDLAGGRVEVVPTAHYMMGGVPFEIDCTTTLPGLFVAGEDSGGVHGANRLGGNGVANSTVFGGIAGETMANWIAGEPELRDPDRERIAAEIARCRRPFDLPAGDLNGLREGLLQLMWDGVGILRDKAGLERAIQALDQLDGELQATGLPDSEPAFNLTWHDWLNLESQILVSRSIATAALAREDSRGAHFREDHPETGDLEKTAYTLVHLNGQGLEVAMKPVDFSIVAPGQSLIDEAAGNSP
jgi:fumarate reductase flavoprotein subunit